MKSFKSTLILFVVAAVFVGLAVYESKTSDERQESELSKDHVFKEIKLEDVLGVTIDHGLGLKQVKLSKLDKTWKLESPIADRADSALVDSFIREVITENVQQLDLADRPIEQFGFANSPVQIQLDFKSGKDISQKKLLLSQVVAFDGSRYLKKENEDKILIGDKKWGMLVERSPQDLRDKLLWSSTDPVTEFAIKNPNQKKEIKFALKDGKWVEQSTPDLRIDQEAVNTFVMGVRSARAINWLSEDQSPASKKSAGVMKELSYVVLSQFRIDYSLTKENMSGMVTGRPGIIRINASDRSLWEKQLSDFRDKAYPFQFDYNQSHKLSLKNGDKTFELKKGSTDWTLENIEAGLQENKPAIDQVIGEIKTLKAQSFSTLRNIGRVNQAISVSNSKGEPLFELQIGTKQKVASSEAYLAKSNLSEEILLIESTKLDPIFKAELAVKPDQIEGKKEFSTDEKDQEHHKGDGHDH